MKPWCAKACLFLLLLVVDIGMQCRHVDITIIAHNVVAFLLKEISIVIIAILIILDIIFIEIAYYHAPLGSILTS